MSTTPTHPHPRKHPIEVLFNAMYHGKWQFSEFASVSTEANVSPKTFTQLGKTRDLLVPSEKLKVFHEFLRIFLMDFLPINTEVVFSYRKGMSAYDAVARHSKNKSFFVCDIADFFPSIKQHRIRSTLLMAKNTCPIEDLDIWIDRIVDLVCMNGSLPVGFSTSPAVSNTVLISFDNHLQAHCKNNGLIFTRYSDDIIISAEGPDPLQDIESQVTKILRDTTQGEFLLHPRKSRFLYSGMKIKLLGMVLLPNGTVSVDASIKNEIEVLIYFYLRDKSKFSDKADGDPRKAEARVSGLLNYVNTIDKAYLDKLRKKFGVGVIDYFLHRSFS